MRPVLRFHAIATAAALLPGLGLSSTACRQSPPAAPAAAEPAGVRVYVGTYTSGDSKGIYRLRLDLTTGALSPEGEPTETVSPSFLALHPDGRVLYAVNETGDGPEGESGGVSAFAIDPASGALRLLGQQPSGGPAPCHLSLDREARHLLVANYWGGSVSVFPLEAEGRLGAATQLVRHTGGTSAPGRDPGPHAHFVGLDATNRFALVADLGRDEVLVYRFEPGSGRLEANDPPALSLGEGSGPRHLAFHPDGRHLFVINELASTVSVLSFDPEAGVLQELQTVTTLPEGYSGSNSTAEVEVSSDGRFLYGSNRGHDSIAIFAIDPESRRLTPLGHESTRGEAPRHFALDPTGSYLLAANQRGDSIAVFRVDPATGGLAPVGEPYPLPSPVCLKMVRVAS